MSLIISSINEVQAAAAEDDDDDMDLFGEETEEEKKAAEDRAAAVKASAKKKESEFFQCPCVSFNLKKTKISLRLNVNRRLNLYSFFRWEVISSYGH